MNDSLLLEQYLVLRDGTWILPLELCHLWNDTGNGSLVECVEHAPILTSTAAIRAIVLAVMALVSFIGNILTIISIRTSKRRRRQHSWSAVYTLIFHLSVSDLLVTGFCIAGEAAWSYSVAWRAGNVGCKLFKYCQMISLYLSTFVLVLIGLDRFMAVRYPIKAISTAKRCSRFVAAAWILSFFLSLPQLFIFHEDVGPFYEEFRQCVTYGFYTEHWQEQLYTTFSFVCMFMLPLAILIASYVSTIVTISKSDKMFRSESVVATDGRKLDINRRRLIHRAKMKSFRISLVIVAAFIVWWTPYYTMMIIFMFLNPDKQLSEELQKGIFFFGMSNSLVNPLIYGAFHLWRPKNRPSSIRSRGEQHTYTRLQRNHSAFERRGNISCPVGSATDSKHLVGITVDGRLQHTNNHHYSLRNHLNPPAVHQFNGVGGFRRASHPIPQIATLQDSTIVGADKVNLVSCPHG